MHVLQAFVVTRQNDGLRVIKAVELRHALERLDGLVFDVRTINRRVGIRDVHLP